MWSPKRTVHISGVEAKFCPDGKQSRCCVLGDGVAGLQFISPFVRDYAVTFPAVCIQSSWSLSRFSTKLYFRHSFRVFTLSTVQIYTTHRTGCINNTRTKMSKNVDPSLDRMARLPLSWSPLQLFVSAPDPLQLKLPMAPGQHLLYRLNYFERLPVWMHQR